MNHISKHTPTVKHDGRIFKNDLIFILSLLTALALLGLGFLMFRAEGDSVEVRVDGQITAKYPLSVDRTVEIVTGKEGEQHNLLVIQNGEARVSQASCPDGICAAHKPIHREGESIVCLPNKVVITVKTVDTTDAPDVVI